MKKISLAAGRPSVLRTDWLAEWWPGGWQGFPVYNVAVMSAPSSDHLLSCSASHWTLHSILDNTQDTVNYVVLSLHQQPQSTEDQSSWLLAYTHTIATIPL